MENVMVIGDFSKWNFYVFSIASMAPNYTIILKPYNTSLCLHKDKSIKIHIYGLLTSISA